MKEGWEVKKLGEVCDRIFAGGDVPKNNYSKTKTEEYVIPIFSNGIKNKGLYGFTNIIKVNEPSITVSARGTIGYSEIRLSPFYPIIRLIVLIPKLEIVDLQFLKFVLESIDILQSGSSIPQLTVPMIKEYNLVVPPLPEQKRIVAILDKAFAAIDKAKENIEKNIENSKELFQSKLNEIFSQKGDGWEEKKLEDVCLKIFAGGDKPKDNFSKEKTKRYKVPIFANGEKKKGLYGYTDITKVTEPSITVSARGTIGYAEIRKESFFPIVRLIVLIPDTDQIYLEYMHFYFKSLNFMSSGVSIPQLTVPMIKQYKMPTPALSEQERIVKILDKVYSEIEQIKFYYMQFLKMTEELKKSLLEKAFKGEL